jgi:transcriptional regulator with XRE-family HTH domain
MKNQTYNPGHPLVSWSTTMPKIKKEGSTFGQRLAQLRKAAGYTQVELAAEIGVTQRVIAYYEGQSDHPPTTLLPAIAQALKITTDELLGTTPIKKKSQPRNTRLHRRLEQIEKLDQKKKRQVLQLIDTIIEGEKFRKKASG